MLIRLVNKMASEAKIEIYTTDFALNAQGADYKGLILVNKVSFLDVPKMGYVAMSSSICVSW